MKSSDRSRYKSCRERERERDAESSRVSDRDAENCRVRDRDVSGTWRGNPNWRVEMRADRKRDGVTEGCEGIRVVTMILGLVRRLIYEDKLGLVTKP